MDIYKSLNVDNVTVTKNPKMLKFVLDYFKAIKNCRHVVKKFPYLLRYFPDQNKTQQMCDKAI